MATKKATSTLETPVLKWQLHFPFGLRSQAYLNITLEKGKELQVKLDAHYALCLLILIHAHEKDARDDSIPYYAKSRRTRDHIGYSHATLSGRKSAITVETVSHYFTFIANAIVDALAKEDISASAIPFERSPFSGVRLFDGVIIEVKIENDPTDWAGDLDDGDQAYRKQHSDFKNNSPTSANQKPQ